MTLSVTPLSGEDARGVLADLGRLRQTVFRAYPYLYDGDAAYEEAYLRTYLDAPGSLIVVARDGDRVVGASTATPLAGEMPDVRAPFERAGEDVHAVLYFGESVLLPEYRGRGLGHAFFDAREAHARTLGKPTTAFCAVVRPDDHLRRPADYTPLDAFWTRRGYAPRADLRGTMTWRDLDEAAPTPKPMQFWVRTAPY
ncbi:GNAT family N-acetyltransferase [Deinococcus maricopensis]|uniref:N-acetyltransferase domain-containing protein n=1 Tax=Deinococcus maricopensis (strain DSM 21211 / LMG 22137 / NRRL B-23946 / LB-34) TaxID=709986 RepID=E8U3W9_DEIML|nr:GNAT family N-acetyltransferase [Deinococcus maricopensis]ADV68812.1 hypothetical protein Deima_3184 [Deinococcus maricopensis DSM 21211]